MFKINFAQNGNCWHKESDFVSTMYCEWGSKWNHILFINSPARVLICIFTEKDETVCKNIHKKNKKHNFIFLLRVVTQDL